MQTHASQGCRVEYRRLGRCVKCFSLSSGAFGHMSKVFEWGHSALGSFDSKVETLLMAVLQLVHSADARIRPVIDVTSIGCGDNL
ncbi:hypothetical protein ACFXTI_029821 [Malus domestica]